MLLVMVTFVGCAAVSQRTVTFPVRGQNPQQMADDQAYCQSVADGRTQDAATAAMLGGAIGAGLGAGGGALLGAVSGAYSWRGSAGRGAGAGAAIGAAAGLLSGIAQGLRAKYEREQSIYVACMASRGYTVGG